MNSRKFVLQYEIKRGDVSFSIWAGGPAEAVFVKERALEFATKQQANEYLSANKFLWFFRVVENEG